jgi:hypothetical protein
MQITESLQEWVNDRKCVITNLAAMGGTSSPAQMQPRFEQAVKSDRNFLRIALVNKDGISTAYYPIIDDAGRSTIGKDFSDRPYIPVLKKTLKPMISDVIVSRFGNTDPIP